MARLLLGALAAHVRRRANREPESERRQKASSISGLGFELRMAVAPRNGAPNRCNNYRLLKISNERARCAESPQDAHSGKSKIPEQTDGVRRQAR